MRLVMVLVLVGACGGSSATPDAGTPGDGPNSPDAPPDVAIDAPGMLSPEPPDPVGTPCTGMLGFPNPPGTVTGQGHVQLARIDNDTLPDMVVRTPNGFGVAHGNGDGTFAPYTITTAFPSNYGEFIVADVDGDGWNDLVFFSDDFHGIEILHGTAGGTFGTRQTLPVAPSITEVQIADLDGSGRRDLVAFAPNTGEVAVLLATATGFSAPVVHTVGEPNTTQLRIGDVTGDGKADLVASNPAASTVTVSTNRGDGTFQTRSAYASGLVSIDGIALADVDEDGKLDVIGGGIFGTSAHVVVMRNNGAGGFPTTVRFPTGTGIARPDLVHVADLDGDGHLDVFAVARGYADAAVLRGTGTGQLVAPIPVDLIDAVTAVDLVDANGDGRIDVFGESVSRPVFLNNGTATLYDSRRTVSFPLMQDLTGARLVDLDGDGIRDAIGFGYEDFQVSALLTRRGMVGGTFAAPSTPLAVASGSSWSILTDLNNDARTDLLLVGAETRAYLNSGTGGLISSGSIPGQWSPLFGSLGDIDGDGFRDLVVTRSTSANTGEIGWVRGHGAGQLDAPTVIHAIGRLVGAVLLDLDADGHLDLVVDDLSQTVQARRYVFRGVAGGTFAAPVMTNIGTPATLRARDVNNDGKVDLLAFSSGEVDVSLGTNTPTIAPPISSPSYGFSDVAFADFNGDGNLDFVGTAPFSGFVYVVLGHGDGRFAAPLWYPAASARSVQVLDTDGDGRLDLVLDDPLRNMTILPGRCR